MAGALDGVRVLDLSRVLAGPWASQLLADLGADVVKIERPGAGDDTRHWGPPWAGEEIGRQSAYYLSANRGKRSVTVDIATKEGAEIVRDLARSSDVLIENYKVGGLKKYGLDYDSLKDLNPGLIYCSITGFGQDGPYARRAGYDVLIQAMGGLMSITGEPDNVPGGGPEKVGVALADILTGLYAANAIQAALLHRHQGGQGQWIDLGLFDVQVATLANQALNYLVGGIAPKRLGNAHPNIVPYQTFKTSNGHMILAVGNDGQFAKFAQVAGRQDWVSDARFATNPARVANREALVPQVAEIIANRTTQNWVRALEAAGVPCGPINTIDQVFDDPQIKHRGLELELEHATAGRVPGVACPIKMTKTPTGSSLSPPALGEHTEQVLAERLGLDNDRIAALKSRNVI